MAMDPSVLVANKYRLVERIGEGGMGSVWRATHEVTQREVAIKFLSSVHTATPALLQRFLRETRMAGRLKHPGLIQVFDAGVDDENADGPYLVMELLDGIALDKAIHRAGKLPVGLALEILHGVACAMVEVHDKGIVHRDLKPANVFLHCPGTGSMITKVLDFGIGKLSSSESPDSIRTLTRSGVIVGSPMYMSPEQAAGDTSIDSRSDIHAMGVLLWECIVGRPLFSSPNPTSLAAQILAASRPRLDEVQPGIPTEVADLVAESVSIERDVRPQSGSAFADRVEQAMEAMGHTSILSARDGAERFMGLLGPVQADVTRGISLLSVDGPPQTSMSSAEVDDDGMLGPALPSEGTVRSWNRSSSPSDGTAMPLSATFKKAALVLGVLCVGAVSGVVASRAFTPPVPTVSVANQSASDAASTPQSVPTPRVKAPTLLASKATSIPIAPKTSITAKPSSPKLPASTDDPSKEKPQSRRIKTTSPTLLPPKKEATAPTATPDHVGGDDDLPSYRK